MTERTLVLIKPDGVGRGLTGQILDRYLAKGYDLVAMQLRTCTPELADAHYADHVAKDWYPPLRAFVTSGPLVAAVLEGPAGHRSRTRSQRRHRRHRRRARVHPG